MNKNNSIKKKFLNSLKRGTGEAYLIMKNNPEIDFSNRIIKGVKKNYAYDGQSEGSRAKYIFDLIALSEKKDNIKSKLLESLAIESEDTWSLTHMFDLAKLFAQEGDIEAKKAIYNRFLSNPIEGSDWVGASEIIQLDGFSGLLFVAEKFGKYIEKNPEDFQDDYIIKSFQEDNPQINVQLKLNNASKKNKFIKIYLTNIERTNVHRKNYVREKHLFVNIIDEVLNCKPRMLYKRKKELTKNEIDKIASHLVKEKDRQNLEKLLSVFSYHKFPLNSELILKIAKHKSTPKDSYSVDALKFLKSKNIRKFAIDRIIKSKQKTRYLDILVSNYKKGDSKLLAELANRYNNEDIIENFAISFTEIYKANKTKECKVPLEILYSKMNCGIHRNSIVEILIENNVLSNKLKNEIEHDSYLATRKLLKE